MRPRAILGVLLLGGVALRLLAIGDPLSHDEGYTWLVSSAHGLSAFYDRLTAYENTPPLYYLLTWPLPDDGVAWLRVVSVLAGVACVAATYWAASFTSTANSAAQVKLAAFFAAAALAVAPFAVSYSDYARGFVLADAALIAALGAALRKRWALYALASAAALYAEYDSALFLIAIAIAMREWRALLPIALLIPWIPAALHANDSPMKVDPVYPNPSPASLRDTLVRLTFGEHGTAHAPSLRWLQLALVIGVAVWAFRKAPPLLAAVAALTLALHAITHWIGPDVFAARYLTELIPLAALAIGYAVAQSTKEIQVAATVILALVAAGVGIRRVHGNGEPDPSAMIRAVHEQADGRRILTNSAVVAYYLRDLQPTLDRPFGLGAGEPCAPGCLIVEDTRVANSPRPGRGTNTSFGPLYVRVTGRGE